MLTSTEYTGANPNLIIPRGMYAYIREIYYYTDDVSNYPISVRIMTSGFEPDYSFNFSLPLNYIQAQNILINNTQMYHTNMGAYLGKVMEQTYIDLLFQPNTLNKLYSCHVSMLYTKKDPFKYQKR